MEKNIYNELPLYFQNIFDSYGFIPQNLYEADSFIKSIYQLNFNSSFEVKFEQPLQHKGHEISSIKVNKENPFVAFVPEFWEKLTDAQKLNSVGLAFNYFANSFGLTNEKKVNLGFVMMKSQAKALGFFFKRSNTVSINMENIFKTNNPLEIVSVIRHELEHARQQILGNELKKLDASELSFEDKILITSKGSSRFVKSINDFMYNISCLPVDDVASMIDLEPQDVRKITQAYFNPRSDLNKLIFYIYTLNLDEKGAFSKGDKVLSQLNKQFEIKNNFASTLTTAQEGIRKCGFDFTDEDKLELIKLESSFSLPISPDEKLNCFKYFIDIYLNHEVTKNFDAFDFNERLNQQAELEQEKNSV